VAAEPFSPCAEKTRQKAHAAASSHHQQIGAMRSRGSGQLLREIPDAYLGAHSDTMCGGVGFGSPQPQMAAVLAALVLLVDLGDRTAIQPRPMLRDGDHDEPGTLELRETHSLLQGPAS